MNEEPIVIIGAGWAGLAAAVKLTQMGHNVTLYESAKQAGGRARSVTFDDKVVDNGQHLLIGAYSTCLSLMSTVGIDITNSLKRLPLLLTVFDKENINKPNSNNLASKLVIKAPKLPAPLHLLYALFTAKGLKFKDRLAALKFGFTLQRNNYKVKQDISVEELFRLTDQTDILIKQLWEPLCLSTLNTPIKEASANVFMRVFKDAFTNKRKDADLLIPTVDLSQLFPDAAIKYIETHGGKVYLKSRVEQIKIKKNQITSLTATVDDNSQTIKTSNIIIATAPQNLIKLLENHRELKPLKNKINQFHYQPIVTVYLQYPKETQINPGMIGMSSSISQWIFDRGHFCQQSGLFSVVISAKGTHMTMDDDKLTKTVRDEVTMLLPNSPALINSFVIREKRATFACNVNINNIRPHNSTDVKGLFLAGDYTDTDYPATLEGAVRSGINAAYLITD